MKITVVCDVLGEKNNGTTLAASNLIAYLQYKEHDVTVVCCDKDKQDLENYFICPTLNLGKTLNKVFDRNGVSVAWADEKILEEAIKNADIVQIEMPLFLGSKAAKIAKKYNKPISASFHAQAENVTAHFGLMNCRLANHLTYKVFYNSLYKYCDNVHYPTEFIKNYFEKHTKKTPATVISNGVNECFYEQREHVPYSNKFTILCTGRYSKEKSQHLLIRAVAKCKYKDNIKVVLAGAGPFKKRLERLAKRKGVDLECNFYDRAAILDILHGADLYVHTALIEIESIACLEAIVSGLVPVINNSPRSATVGFALDENNLFKLNDVKNLANKIEFWYENPELKAEYVAKYKTSVSKYDQQECMQRMEEMLIKTAQIKKDNG